MWQHQEVEMGQEKMKQKMKIMEEGPLDHDMVHTSHIHGCQSIWIHLKSKEALWRKIIVNKYGEDN